MTDPSPEVHEFTEDPENLGACSVCGVAQADHPVPEEPAPPVCVAPTDAVYRTERQANMVASIGRYRYAYQCPVGHWHVGKRNPGDSVPAPTDPPAEGADAPQTAETEPRKAETEPGNVQRRGPGRPPKQG